MGFYIFIRFFPFFLVCISGVHLVLSTILVLFFLFFKIQIHSWIVNIFRCFEQELLQKQSNLFRYYWNIPHRWDLIRCKHVLIHSSTNWGRLRPAFLTVGNSHPYLISQSKVSLLSTFNFFDRNFESRWITLVISSYKSFQQK